MNANASNSLPLGDQGLPAIRGPAKTRLSGRVLMIAGLVWIAILATGFFALAREEWTPVAGAVARPAFPPQSTLALAPDVPTLILFAHPHCPCTRASIHELGELLTGLENRVRVDVIFTLPKGVAPRWEQGPLWQEAVAIPGARVTTDQDGREAERFGVKGSGHVLLYRPSGELVFSGGITPSRGHEGDNPGRSAVVGLVVEGRSSVSHAPVYGCPLLEPASSPSQP